MGMGGGLGVLRAAGGLSPHPLLTVFFASSASGWVKSLTLAAGTQACAERATDSLQILFIRKITMILHFVLNPRLLSFLILSASVY